MKKLFTVVAEFKGGTYVSQNIAENVNHALNNWCEHLDSKGLEGIDYLTIEELQVIKEKENPTPLSGLKNVLFSYFNTKTGDFFLNIIQTEV